MTSPNDDGRPVASKRSGRVLRPRDSAAMAPSANIHAPLREMATVVTS